MKHILSFLGITLVLLCVDSAEANKNKKEARAAFKQGVNLFEEGAYSDAAKAFRRANELYPKWTILYNIAQSEVAAKRYGVAYELFEQYLAEGGDEVSEARRKEIVQELDRLTTLVGSVEVEDAPHGSEVWVGGLKRGTTPLPGKLLVSIGTVHKIEIVHMGQTIHQTETKVIRGETVRVSLKEEEEDHEQSEDATASGESSEPVEEAEPLAYAPETERDTTAFIGWVMVGTGAAFLGVGGVTGGLALMRNSKLKERCVDNVCAQKDKDYAKGRDLLAISSNIAFGIGAAAAVSGVVLLVLLKKSKNDERDDSGAAVSIAPFVTADFTGLSISGRY